MKEKQDGYPRSNKGRRAKNNNMGSYGGNQYVNEILS